MIDDIECLLDVALFALATQDIQTCMMQLAQAKGICQAYGDQHHMWQRIKERYEGGDKVKDIAVSHSVSPGSISTRACRYGWLTTPKINRLGSKPGAYKKLVKCHGCNQEFLTESGHAKRCDQCKAAEFREHVLARERKLESE